MGTYLIVGLILAGFIYRKKLWEIFMAVIMWPWALIEMLRQKERQNKEES